MIFMKKTLQIIIYRVKFIKNLGDALTVEHTMTKHKENYFSNCAAKNCPGIA